MCYAIPGKIVKLEGNLAVVDYFGEERNALNEFDLKLGDYVYAQGGAVIQKIETSKALEILEGWKEDFEKLKLIDEKLSLEGSEPKSLWLKDLEQGISKEEALKILELEDEDDMSYVFHKANKVRVDNLSNSSCIHGIIEFSNYCRNDCTYCGIRKSNSNLKRYRMKVEEIVDLAVYTVEELNFKALVLQSGEDIFYTREMIVEIIKKIKSKCDVMIFLSIGDRSIDEYEAFYEAGARGILMRFETCNRKIYDEIHEGIKSDFVRRMNLVLSLKKVGYLVATGFLIGLPGQTKSQIIEEILFTQSINPDMYSFGPLIPSEDTPLKDEKTVSLGDVLKVVAVTRLIDPESKILVTTALETMDKKGRVAGLMSGGNSLMINITPLKYKTLYSIYPGKKGIGEEVEKDIREVIEDLYSIGRAPTDLGL